MNAVRIGIILSLAMTGCLAVENAPDEDLNSTAAAVLGGTPDQEYPAVCSMSVPRPPNDNGQPQDPRLCTCSLVGAQTILTSASCLFEYVDAMLTGPITVTFGASVGSGTPFTVTGTEIFRYYTDETPSANDLAFARLDGAPQATPMAINATELTAADVGSDLILVGYGEQDNEGADFGTRRKITVPIRSVDKKSVFAGTAEATTCDGDSGGPGLSATAAEPTIMTVTTRQLQCFENASRTRVDRFTETFLYPYIDRFDGACVQDGTCSTAGCRTPDPDCEPCAWNGACEENCPTRDWDCALGKFAGESCSQDGECEQGGRCVAAADDPSYTYCSKTCLTGFTDECPQGMVCDDQGGGSGECIFDPTMPTPGSQGYRCSFGSECRSGICEELICVTECDPNAAACAEGYTCGPSAESPGKNVCLGRQFSGGGGFCTADAAGASTRNGGRPFGLAMLLAAGFALLVVRRRRA